MQETQMVERFCSGHVGLEIKAYAYNMVNEKWDWGWTLYSNGVKVGDSSYTDDESNGYGDFNFHGFDTSEEALDYAKKEVARIFEIMIWDRV